MDVINLLKQLKSIEADRHYKARSRSLILSVKPHGFEKAGVNPFRLVLRVLEYSSSIALVAVFLIVLLGGISVFRAFAPFRLSSLDPSSLKAEAEDVDIQIYLTDLNYEYDSFTAGANESTPSLISPSKKVDLGGDKEIIEEVQKKALDLGLKSEPTSTAGVSIDEALKKLGE